MEWGEDEADPREFIKSFRTDLFDDEVYVFTPKGDVKTLPGARRRSTSRTRCTPTSGTAPSARRSTGVSSLHYTLHSGDFVEILTSEGRPRPVARLDDARPVVARPQQDPPVVLAGDA